MNEDRGFVIGFTIGAVFALGMTLYAIDRAPFLGGVLVVAAAIAGPAWYLTLRGTDVE